MRMIGLILALGAIGWALYQAAGGGDAETAVPESYQQSTEKAQDVEKTMQEALHQRMREPGDEE